MFQKATRFAGTCFLIFVICWLLMEYCLPIGLPFLLGFLLAKAAEPATGLLQRRLGLPRAAAVALSVSAVCFLAATIVIFLLGFLWRQMQQLTAFLPQLETTLQQGTDLLQAWLLELSHKLPGTLGILSAELTDQLFSSGSAIMEQAVMLLPKLFTGLVGGLSRGAFGLITGIISAYMLAARLPAWQAWWQTHQPQRWQEAWLPALSGLKKAMGGWLLAEAKLAGVAFGIMTLGFLLLRISRPLLWAGLITLVDALPVFGVGTVLVPWAAICFLQGNGVRGVGLLAVYGVVWLTRSVLEPKLLGKGLGLDPLVTLIAIYAGWKLWGVAGLLLAPLLALAATQILKQVR